MNITSWNIQAAKGVDNVTSVDRIAADIKKLGDADVICLQEVLCTASSNQVEELSAHFQGYETYFGPAIDRLDENGRLKFGNLILTRLPVLQALFHKLPQPAEPGIKHMPRQAIELLLDDGSTDGSLRVTTTHLDYFAQKQRTAQVKYFVEHYNESCDRAANPSLRGGELQFQATPESNRCIYIGDFNLTVDSPDYQLLVNTAELNDCWTLANPGKPHAPTCGIFDHIQWQEGSHCRDFCFASNSLATSVSAMQVDIETAASDHQPFLVSLS